MTEEVYNFQELAVLPKEPLPPPLPLKRASTLPNLWEDFVKTRGRMSRASVDYYYYIGKRFLKFMRAKDLTPQTIMSWCYFLRTEKMPRKHPGGKVRYTLLSPHRVNQINTRVKGFLKFLYKLNYINLPLWEFIQTLTEPERKPGLIITEQEYENIKAYMTGKERWQILLWLCIVAYRTGMSMIDCCHLRWKDVALNENGPSFIDIYRRKTQRLGEKALCQIPVVPGTDLHQWLLRLRKVENYKRADGIDDFVNQDAPGYYNNCMKRPDSDVRRIFNEYGLAPGRTFRNFRNSLCSNLVNSGAQLALVCMITGHNNVKTLLQYLNVDREALEDAMLKAYQHAEAKG